MTIGIYKLSFNNDEEIYIGQSIDIERRYKQHISTLKNKTNNPNLVKAFDIYGIPKLSIEKVCLISELNEIEDKLILEYSKISKLLNIKQSSKDTPRLIGDTNGNAKFSNSQIIEVLYLLTEDNPKSIKEISDITKVNLHTITAIKNSNTHLWLEEAFPERYQILKDKKYTYHKIVSPTGEVFEFTNIAQFAALKGLDRSTLCKVLKGTRPSHIGWTLYLYN
jgi:group I intron endonuclease